MSELGSPCAQFFHVPWKKVSFVRAISSTKFNSTQVRQFLELARRILQDSSTKFSSPVCRLFFGNGPIGVRDWTAGSNDSKGLRLGIGPIFGFPASEILFQLRILTNYVITNDI